MVNSENHDKVTGDSLEQEKPLEEQNQEQATPDAAPADAAQQEIAELKDKYLRLYSEFDNFRRRTAKERIELMQTAGKEVVLSMLPVLDDFERALKSFGEVANDPVKEGVQLIYHKMKRSLESQGLKEMESNGAAFNPDLHEAITQIPAPTEELKGKVVDTVEKGYYLQETVVRFAKVVIGN